MKWQAATLAIAQMFAFIACASAGSPADPSVKLDQAFSLKVGTSASVDGEGIEIGFDSVVSDSRCPKGAQCIVAGEATIRIWLTRTGQARETRELKTNPPDAAQTSIGSYRVTLTSLMPEPTVDGAPRASDYVATLVVARLP